MHMHVFKSDEQIFMCVYTHVYCLCIYILDCTQICAISNTCSVFELCKAMHMHVFKSDERIFIYVYTHVYLFYVYTYWIVHKYV